MVEVESIKSLKELLASGANKDLALISLDLSKADWLLKYKLKNCLFLGCGISKEVLAHLHGDNYVFPKLNLPFKLYPKVLYTKESLYKGYDPKRPESYEKTPDRLIYKHYKAAGTESRNVQITLARSLHDHSVIRAKHRFLDDYSEKQIVGIMGGHGLSRRNKNYTKIVQLSKKLTEQGYLMTSGGGPGAMEATHVGAWFAGKSKEEMLAGIQHLKQAPTYKHEAWLVTAFEVMEKFPNPLYKSLSIPTWLYGHEPPTPFASHIAKLFNNSDREEGLMTIAKGGIVYAPGSAGTLQEIFLDLAQNHYETAGFPSPMIFLDKQFWSYDMPIYPLLALLKLRKNLKNMDLGIYNKNTAIIRHIKAFSNGEITNDSI